MSSLYIEEHESILIDPSTETLVPMVDRYVTVQSISLDATASISGQTCGLPVCNRCVTGRDRQHALSACRTDAVFQSL
jgi:hypothetical protein